ncbi:hypothetical protein [Tolypothrix sp. VBCCA 56010]
MLLYTAVESPKDFSNVAESSMAVMQLLLKESEESKKSKKLEESKKSEE